MLKSEVLVVDTYSWVIGMSETNGNKPGDSVPKVEAHSVVEINQRREMVNQSNRKLIICFIGIFVCYFYYGILQEKITKGEYRDGEKKDKFTYTLALVFVQCIINALFSRAALGLSESNPDRTPSSLYALCSLSYLGAMLASNHSLQHVSYPTQVLGKSVKPIPVMILGVLLARKRYPLAKYMCVLMIVAGVALFMYKDKKDTKGSSDHVVGIGELLLLISLTLDGVTGATQDRMRGDHQTNAKHMMFNVNLWSILWLAIGLVLTGEGVAFIKFAQKYPFVLVHMVSFSVASAIGQTFIFYTVTTFGPLTCSIITTTRKFFTILGSVIIFQHPMSSRQWLGTVLVFTGLSLDSAYGKEKKKQ